MQDLVRVGVADATEEFRIRQGAFERVVFAEQHVAKRLGAALHDLDTTGCKRLQLPGTAQHVDGRAFFCGGLREHQGSVCKRKCGQINFSGWPGVGLFPVESAGNHQVKDDEQVVIEFPDDSLADAAQPADPSAGTICYVGIECTNNKRAANGYRTNLVFPNEPVKRSKVNGNVGKLGHVCDVQGRRMHLASAECYLRGTVNFFTETSSTVPAEYGPLRERAEFRGLTRRTVERSNLDSAHQRRTCA